MGVVISCFVTGVLVVAVLALGLLVTAGGVLAGVINVVGVF